MKLLIYILYLTVALILFFETEWAIFWTHIVFCGFLIVYGNKLENNRIN